MRAKKNSITISLMGNTKVLSIFRMPQCGSDLSSDELIPYLQFKGLFTKETNHIGLPPFFSDAYEVVIIYSWPFSQNDPERFKE